MLLQQFGLSQYAGFEFVGGQTFRPESTSDAAVFDSLTGGSGSAPIAGDILIVGICGASISEHTGLDDFTVAASLLLNDGYGGRLWCGYKKINGPNDYTVSPNSAYWTTCVVAAMVFRGARLELSSTVETALSSNHDAGAPALTLDSADSVVIAAGGAVHTDGVATFQTGAVGGGRTAYTELISLGADQGVDVTVGLGFFLAADTAEQGEVMQSNGTTPNADDNGGAISFALRANL